MARRKKTNEEESSENQDNLHNESDDTFGLPEVEYEPLNREEVTAEEEASKHSTYIEEPEPEPVQEEVVEEHHEEYRSVYSDLETEGSSPWPKILGIVLLALVAGAGIWYFAVYRPKQKAAEELARKEEQARIDAANKRRADEERLAAAKREAEQRRLDSLANLSKEGTVEALEGKTGRYYVVVASGIDDDLLLDFAKKLTHKGKNCKLIPPFGKSKFYRLAVDEKDSYADAQSAADALKGGDFGDQIWVVRY
jgi:hypothetical protein